MTPTFSIIVATCGRPTLTRTLESLAPQLEHGDELLVTFKEAPSVRLVLLFTFTLRVESVSISDSKVVVKFSGSRWIKERTFHVE